MNLDWLDHAACSQTGHDTFFPAKGEGNVARDAKQVCARCPVQQLCLGWVMATEPAGERFGIFGGLTSTERRQLAARRRKEMAA